MLSDCHPLDTNASRVRRHHSTFELYDVGFECFCLEMSEYKDCKRDFEELEYVGNVDKDEGAKGIGEGGIDMMVTRNRDTGHLHKRVRIRDLAGAVTL